MNYERADFLYTYEICMWTFVFQVASCTACNVMRPWSAVIVGAIAGVSFNTFAWLMTKLKIDDPVDAVAGWWCHIRAMQSKLLYKYNTYIYTIIQL